MVRKRYNQECLLTSLEGHKTKKVPQMPLQGSKALSHQHWLCPLLCAQSSCSQEIQPLLWGICSFTREILIWRQRATTKNWGYRQSKVDDPQRSLELTALLYTQATFFEPVSAGQILAFSSGCKEEFLFSSVFLGSLYAIPRAAKG